nr:hypothetical protein BHI3_27310 [Bacteriovorax sp. HI3]
MSQSQDQLGLIHNILFRFPAMIGYWDSHLKNKFANKAYASFFGFSSEEMLDKHIKDFLGDFLYKQNLPYIEKALEGSEQLFLRERKMPNGETKFLQVIYVPDLLEKEVLGFYVFINDLTAFKKIEREKEELYQKLIQSSKMIALGQMAGGIAHEINNPLSVVNMNARFAQDLIDDYNMDRNKLQTFISNIQVHSNRIEKIVTGLQFFSQERPHEPYAPYSLSTIIEDTLSFCKAKINAKRITFIQSKLPSDIILNCNPVQISQVLLNLLNNSIDALEDHDEKWISLVIKNYPESVGILVIDSGKGIAEEIADRIMQPFVSGKPTGKGTGLGLSISKGIISQHGGELSIDREAKNTTFIITLPKPVK